ncbi:hypothetical protein [Halobacillus sp. A5]|uniref:hypothetical protein n=1 Tax=Halobacillus sp. A5 TaxID=2880263 RepID=UPI0020A67E09|nr:hypothetical protein [Halobacillus sp. A5]MCP3026620.1 hypothetical protein [Halobacillus sp. A5]
MDKNYFLLAGKCLFLAKKLVKGDVNMAKVFLHIHDAKKANWENLRYEFERLPIEGEFFALGDSDWYQVELVVHTPFKKDLAGEIYGVKVDHMEIKNDRLDSKEFTPTTEDNPFK